MTTELVRIAVVGGGFANKGGEAMLLTVANELHKRLGGLEIVMWGCRPTERDRALKAGLVPVSLPETRTRLHRAVWFLGGLIKHPRTLRTVLQTDGIQMMMSAVRGQYLTDQTGCVHAVVDVSGLAYRDAENSRRTEMVSQLVVRARAAGAALIFMPQAWGPFTQASTRVAVRGLLRGPSTAIYSRDMKSMDHLGSLFRPLQNPALMRSDIAFCFAKSPVQDAGELLGHVGCSGTRPIVVLAPNIRVYEHMGPEGGELLYVNVLTLVAQELIDREGVDVVVQANEVGVSADHRGDAWLCHRIHAQIDREGRSFVLAESMDAASVRSLIGCCEMLIASRFHSLVFGLSQGVPCASIGWSHKYPQLLQRFGLEDFVFDFREVNESLFLSRVFSLWEQRVHFRRQVLSELPTIWSEIDDVFDTSAATIEASYRRSSLRCLNGNTAEES